MTPSALDAALHAAHKSGDGAAIAKLYGQAGDAAAAAGRLDEACFFWVQAFIFALEAGDESALRYQAALAEHGREAPPNAS